MGSGVGIGGWVEVGTPEIVEKKLTNHSVDKKMLELCRFNLPCFSAL